MDKKEIEQGQVWEVVTDNFLVNEFHRKMNGRKILLKKAERLEIRFPYAWHFRTEDGIFFHADPVDILANCKLIGKVWKDVSWQNNASLEEILRLRLYDLNHE